MQEKQLLSYEENSEYNPIFHSQTLRARLICKAELQKEPVIIKDEFHMFYSCVKWESTFYLMGPLSTQVMSRIERHRFYHFYGIDEKWEKGLHYHTLMEILQVTGLFAKILTGREYTD